MAPPGEVNAPLQVQTVTPDHEIRLDRGRLGKYIENRALSLYSIVRVESPTRINSELGPRVRASS